MGIANTIPRTQEQVSVSTTLPHTHAEAQRMQLSFEWGMTHPDIHTAVQCTSWGSGTVRRVGTAPLDDACVFGLYTCTH